MKKITYFAVLSVALVMNACSTKVLFPVSTVTPAAEITAKMTKQGGTNYFVTIEANNLASSDRLIPSKKFYVIWIVSASGTTRNVGYFFHKNASNAAYKASFPYQPSEVFITAEDQDGLCSPMGTEISRVKF
jgi:hypothetical protein